MKKLFEFKDFDTFVRELNENRNQKKSAVENAVNKIKEKYGDNAKDFIAAVSKDGVDDVKDFIAKTVQPIERLNPRELNPDYDNILLGLVCWITLELQLEKTNKETLFLNFLIIFYAPAERWVFFISKRHPHLSKKTNYHIQKNI